MHLHLHTHTSTVKIRDSLSWKAIRECKENPCCSSLKMYIVPYYSKKYTHAHTHTLDYCKPSRDPRQVEESRSRGHEWHSWQEFHHHHLPWPKLHTYLWAHLHKEMIAAVSFDILCNLFLRLSSEEKLVVSSFVKR